MEFRLAATNTQVTMSFDEAGKDYIAAQFKEDHYELRMVAGAAMLFPDKSGGHRIYPPLGSQKRWTLCWLRKQVAGLGEQRFGVTPVTVTKGDGCLTFRLPGELNRMRAQTSWRKANGKNAHRGLEHDLDRIALANGLRQQLDAARDAVLPRLNGDDRKLAEQLFAGIVGFQKWAAHCNREEVAQIEHLCARLGAMAR